MLSSLFPLIYTAGIVLTVIKVIQWMASHGHGTSTAKNRDVDRTGLKTIHPELLDENGVVTEEELWAVRFEDLDGFSIKTKV
ncbi:DUF2973 domain-containing protein [Synechococcus sp. MIT S1220]|uniref:DUF2973 domain-containing protein n=1 Tax=Synechococcus sp. MIT S1220 TaxID=3082549 RepID=UPI0039AED7FD